MLIGYYAKSNSVSDNTEQHIFNAFTELGHTVEWVPMGGDISKYDFILFHKDYPRGKGVKVCWYFDKIYTNERKTYIKEVLKHSDYVFLTDETWASENYEPKIHILRQGIGDVIPGTRVKTNALIAFTGSLYGNRYEWAGQLTKRYGEQFQVFTNVFNRDLNNLCTTVPIFVAPKEPSDDYYWSSRVYITLGSGGFLIHPRLKGLEEEYEDGKEIVFYDSQEDLYKKIDYYLAHPEEREKIRVAGYEKTKNNYTYKHRVCTLVSTIQEKLNEIT